MHHDVLHYNVNLGRNFQNFLAYFAFGMHCFTFYSQIHNNFKKIPKECKVFTTNRKQVTKSPKKYIQKITFINSYLQDEV